jgi:ubiquitin-activating enzyme E1
LINIQFSAGEKKTSYYVKTLPNIIVPDFTPKKGIKISTDEKETEGSKQEVKVEDDDDIAKRIIAELPAPSSLAGYRLTPVEFEKVSLHCSKN